MSSTQKIDTCAQTALDKTLVFHDEEQLHQIDPEDLKKKLGIKDYSNIDFYGATTTLGAGGAGQVLKGHDRNLGRDVAVKILHPNSRSEHETIERFIREARATAQIEHPNIVPVLEMGVNPDWGLYFTMKKIVGEDLKEILIKLKKGNPEYEKKYTLSKLLNIFTDVCNGVSYAHSKGIIHRDLKPENIFVGDFGEVLVIDWGLVREINPKKSEYKTEKSTAQKNKGKINETVNINIDDSQSPHLTMDGSVSGTPHYMSPEQAKGENRNMDHRSDIYTLGVILYQLLTLKRPFEGNNISELMDLVAIGDFILPRKAAPSRKIPIELEAICLKSMSYDPINRYQNVRELIDDIYRYLDNVPVSSMHYSIFNRFRKMCLRHQAIASSIATVVMFAVLAIGIYQTDKYIKYYVLFNQAKAHIENSICEFRKANQMLKEPETLMSKKDIKEKSKQLINLNEKIKQAEKKAEDNVKVALALLDAIPESFRDTQKVHGAYVTLLKEQIAHTLQRKNYVQTHKLLNKLELLLQMDNSLTQSEKKMQLDELREQIKNENIL